MAPSANSELFARLLRNWALLTPPLRPNDEIVDRMAQVIGSGRGGTLLLGATAEFAQLAEEIVAVDLSPAMIAALWRREAPSRLAAVGDWRRLPFAPKSFDLCIADGSLSLMRFPDELEALCIELARVLRPGAKLVLRTFVGPDRPETLASLKEAALARTMESFHTYKWRLGMALAASAPGYNIPIGAIFDAFNAMFPDRDGLVRATGWNREQIEAINQYSGATSVLSFPPRNVLAQAATTSFADVHYVESGTYEMAELCPLLVMRRD
jgi:SAM-dependent methyltransferase